VKIRWNICFWVGLIGSNNGAFGVVSKKKKALLTTFIDTSPFPHDFYCVWAERDWEKRFER
jgi:hypothetical protein